MGVVLDFLTPEWVDQRLAPPPSDPIDISKIEFRKEVPVAIAEALRNAMGTWVETKKTLPLAKTLDISLRDKITSAELAFVRGASANQVRAIYRSIAEPWLDVFKHFDWTPKFVTYPRMSLKEAEGYVKAFGAVVDGHGNNRTVSFSPLPQPKKGFEILQCAAISGDAGFAKELAGLCQVFTPLQSLQFGDPRFSFLRELMVGNDAEAAEHLGSWRGKGGYPMDWPPERLEIPHGILKNDAGIILAGVEAITKRCKSMWDAKKYRKKHAVLLTRAEQSHSKRPVPTLEEFLDHARRDLVALKWLLSPWAIAFLNIAAWRGMTEVFADAKAFSEWVPLELCRPIN